MTLLWICPDSTIKVVDIWLNVPVTFLAVISDDIYLSTGLYFQLNSIKTQRNCSETKVRLKEKGVL